MSCGGSPALNWLFATNIVWAHKEGRCLWKDWIGLVYTTIIPVTLFATDVTGPDKEDVPEWIGLLNAVVCLQSTECGWYLYLHLTLFTFHIWSKVLTCTSRKIVGGFGWKVVICESDIFGIGFWLASAHFLAFDWKKWTTLGKLSKTF